MPQIILSSTGLSLSPELYVDLQIVFTLIYAQFHQAFLTQRVRGLKYLCEKENCAL